MIPLNLNKSSSLSSCSNEVSCRDPSSASMTVSEVEVLLTFGLMHTESWDLQFLSNNPGSFDQRTELAKGYFSRQVFHAAVRCQDQALWLYILQG